jgi:hypothetical protein
MSMKGGLRYGWYHSVWRFVPRYRLSRMLIIQNMAWYFPVIMAVAGGGKGPKYGLTNNLGGFPMLNICSIAIMGRYGN